MHKAIVCAIIFQLILPSRAFSAPPSKPYDAFSAPDVINRSSPEVDVMSSPSYTGNFNLTDRAGRFGESLSGTGGRSGIGLFTSDELLANARGSEYISGYYKGAVLMTVEIWGAVKLSGTHHVPTQTSLSKLIAYAGGPVNDADLSELVIKRQTKGKEEVITVDVENLLENKEGFPMLEADDIVMVPAKRPWISNNALAVVGITASLLGIVVSGLLISQQARKD